MVPGGRKRDWIGEMVDEPLALAARTELGGADLFEPPVSPVEARDPWPVPRRDYVRVAAWVFAFFFGPALAALAVLMVIWLT